jgi:hypothetical protein
VSEATMIPRERMLTALNHERPDRTPRDSWAEECTWKRLLVSGIATCQRWPG